MIYASVNTILAELEKNQARLNVWRSTLNVNFNIKQLKNTQDEIQLSIMRRKLFDFRLVTVKCQLFKNALNSTISISAFAN